MSQREAVGGMLVGNAGRVPRLVQQYEEAHAAAALRVAIGGLAEEDLVATDECGTAPRVATEGVDGDRDRLAGDARSDHRRIDDLGRRGRGGREMETRDEEAGEDEPAQHRCWPTVASGVHIFLLIRTSFAS